jgi:hypothetical protein
MLLVLAGRLVLDVEIDRAVGVGVAVALSLLRWLTV